MTTAPHPRPRHPWRRVGLTVGALGLCLWIYLTGPTTEPEEKKRPPRIVKTVSLTPTNASITVSAYGSVIPARRVAIEPQVSGHIIRLNPRLIPGGQVREGDELYAIDPRLAELNLQEAEAEVARAEADLREAERRRNEGQRLAAEAVIPATELASLESEVRVRTAELERLRVRAERNQELLHRHIVTAPFNALVLSESIEVGQRVDPGDATAVLVGTDEFWVQAALPTDKLPWVVLPSDSRPGAPVRVWNDTGTDSLSVYPARVVQLQADIEEVGRMARVLIQVEDPLQLKATRQATPLLLGSYVRVEIDAGTLEDVLVVERPALREGNRVWLVDRQNRLQIRDVQVRWRQADLVYLTAELHPGEQLVVSDLRVALPGTEVKPQPTALPPAGGSGNQASLP